jgi:hypothetical protein
MKYFRNKAEQWLDRLLGDTGGIGANLSAASDSMWAKRSIDIAWLIVMVLLAICSMIAMHTMPTLSAQWLLALSWGIFVGCSVLLFLPQKIVITGIGSLFGVGAADLSGAANVVESFAKTIANILKIINTALENQLVIHVGPAWLFLIILLLCGLPAYRNEQ